MMRARLGIDIRRTTQSNTELNLRRRRLPHNIVTRINRPAGRGRAAGDKLLHVAALGVGREALPAAL